MFVMPQNQLEQGRLFLIKDVHTYSERDPGNSHRLSSDARFRSLGIKSEFLVSFLLLLKV